MTAYCLMQTAVKTDQNGDYLTPDFPSDVGGLLLASSDEGNWRIYEYDDHANPEWSPELAVSDELRKLIDSAKRFPPALALARDDVSHQLRGHPPSPDELADTFAGTLKLRLSQQKEMSFVLAIAVGEEPGYLWRGEWYWVLAASRSQTAVRWVSEDYFVYGNPASDFDLTATAACSDPVFLI